MRLNFEVHGDGPPLILVHGLLGALDNWRSMSKRLATRYRVYSIDLRNHGHSPHSEMMNYSVMAQDLSEFFNAHNIESAFVLGHSLGGKIAMQLALESAARVDKLIVADMAPKSYPPVHRPLLATLRQLNLGRLKSFADAEAALAPAIGDAALRQFLIKNLERAGDGSFHWRIALDSIIANYDELIKAIRSNNRFDKPVCFLRAGRSEYIEAADLTLIRKHFPRAELRTIADAGHWLHIEAPDEFFRIVTDFFGPP
ncbi:MAG TPA: alpha/beta fold hydrolase [Verrucomicrobiae bacterium]|nr:alpha/beta fold hydrolase [Verrucomicrobiae bacterium]